MNTVHEKSNQEKLDDMYKLVQENHEVLQDLLRRERLASFGRILYWILVLGTLFGAYYYIRPVVEIFIPKMGSFNDALDKFSAMSNQLPEVSKLKAVFYNLKQN